MFIKKLYITSLKDILDIFLVRNGKWENRRRVLCNFKFHGLANFQHLSSPMVP